MIQFTVKQARTHANLTQEEMAKMLNMSRFTYRKYETHPEMITIEKARKISEITNIPMDMIFFAN